MKRLLIALQMLFCFGLAAGSEESYVTQGESPSKTKSKRGREFQRGDDPIESLPNTFKGPGAYNYPANVDLSWGWDVYADVAYLYWYVNEDGLDLATTGAYIFDSILVGGTNGTSAVFQRSDYTSGVKAGLGANLNRDDWVIDLEYTYLRENTKALYSNPTPPPPGVSGIGAYNFTGWVVPYSFSGYSTGAVQFYSKWIFQLDWLDLQLKRPYYQGRALTVTPSVGLRASWIKQELKITSSTAEAYEFPFYDLLSQTSSKSWAIGPRGLVDLRWFVGRGVRFQGNVGGSLLFTQYTRLEHSDNGLAYEQPTGASFLVKNFNSLRPMAEANLGFGWGMYFARSKIHWDLSATYDFNYLWSQNMLRYTVNLNSQAGDPSRTPPSTGTGAAFYDAYLHGLTVKTRLDF